MPLLPVPEIPRLGLSSAADARTVRIQTLRGGSAMSYPHKAIQQYFVVVLRATTPDQISDLRTVVYLLSMARATANHMICCT